MRVLATYNIKGGVGKTSAAVNFAALAAAQGYRTLLWDLDPQGSATYLFRVKPKVRGGVHKLIERRSDVQELLKGTDIENLDLLPADFSYRHMDLALGATKRPEARLGRLIEPLGPDYDLVILDCPPSISLLSESVFESADALLVPLIPATLSVRTFEQLLRFVEEQVADPPEIVAFFSMVDRRKRLHREVVDGVGHRYPQVATTVIPAASDVERMGVERRPVVAYAPSGAAGRAYRALWDETVERLALGPGPGHRVDPH
ncbi:MAG: AAA family ATPase [Acidobacteriota bacterium]|nr:AAA family ATPase [Acidobacteriota bacterium]